MPKMRKVRKSLLNIKRKFSSGRLFVEDLEKLVDEILSMEKRIAEAENKLKEV